MDQLSFEDVPAEDEPEIWLPVVGYEGRYEVSSLGRIKSLPRQGTRGGIMKTYQNAAGYHVATLSVHRAKYLVHRLVLEAFVGACPEGMEALHGDDNPASSTLGNLKWDTHTENIRQIVRNGHNHNKNKTHCPRKHPYNEENTKVRASGGRDCIPCNRIRAREAHARKKDRRAV